LASAAPEIATCDVAHFHKQCRLQMEAYERKSNGVG